MATLKYCPNCESPQECIKKGFNKSGEQVWLCKKCNKRFVAITNPETKTKKSKASISKKPEKKTIIYVNNTKIKESDSNLSIDQAFDLVASYFREISKDAVNVIENKTEKTITFTIKVGSKG
ncbi:hypothetical protein M0P25_03755 [archaeon]|nr:hypothetical protein [archaeon]MCK9439393.1 hypothetical protein [Patescibacteria group bacterium]